MSQATKHASRGVSGERANTRRPDAGRRVVTRRQKEGRAAYLILTPWLLGLFLITLGPMIASVYLSMTDYSLLASPEWVGLDNYRRILFDDQRARDSGLVTLLYVGVSIPILLTVALLLALTLDKGLRGMSFYRSVFYLPSLIGGSVGIAILWRRVFGREGLVNWALGAIGIEGPAWLSDPRYALTTLIILNVWTFGSAMIIFLAGLRQIPQEYYEAGMVDGAGKLRSFWHITLPLLTPIIFFNLVLQTINAMQAFTPAFIVSGGSGGPRRSTLFFTLYIYQEGFTNFRMGYAAGLAWVLLLVIGVFTAVYFATARWWVHYES